LPAFEAATAAGVAIEFIAFDSTDAAGDICEIARSKGSDYVLLGMHRPVLGQNLLGGTVGRVLEDSPAPVALLVDHGLSQAFARGPRAAESKRVVAAICGGSQDALVLSFAEALLSDPAVRLTVLLVGLPQPGPGSLAERATALMQRHGERVLLREELSPTPESALLAQAVDAALLVVGLDPAWGLSSERLGPEAMGLLDECPASLIVLHGKSATS